MWRNIFIEQVMHGAVFKGKDKSSRVSYLTRLMSEDSKNKKSSLFYVITVRNRGAES